MISVEDSNYSLNKFIKFMILIYFKILKIQKLNFDKVISVQEKYSKSQSVIKDLMIHLPEIDESKNTSIHECCEKLSKLSKLFGDFTEGSEYPFSSTWELLQSLSFNISKYLVENDGKMLLKRAFLIIETLDKSVQASAPRLCESEWCRKLLEGIRSLLSNSVEIQASQEKVNTFFYVKA